MAQALELKLLDVHPDKTCHVIVAGKTKRIEIEEEMKKNPLMYNAYHTKENIKEIWLVGSRNGTKEA